MSVVADADADGVSAGDVWLSVVANANARGDGVVVGKLTSDVRLSVVANAGFVAVVVVGVLAGDARVSVAADAGGVDVGDGVLAGNARVSDADGCSGGGVSRVSARSACDCS